jgi:hypothetical protein
MNHKYVTLGIAAIVAAIAVTAAGFAMPQQALAHSGHHHHNNGVDVNQQISQANFCANDSACENSANNQVDIDR